MPTVDGALWRRTIQIGKETTYGVPVVATRKLYVQDIALTREQPAIAHQFDTGTRERVRAVTYGSIVGGGSVGLPASADELLEFFLMGVKGGVTPTTPAGYTNGRRWFFTPGETLDSATIEELDGANIWRMPGVYVNSITITGNVREGTHAVTIELFSKDKAALGALTGALAERVPTFFSGWQAQLWVDAFGGTPMTTKIGNALISYTFTFNNNLFRKYFADNTQATGRVVAGALDCTLQVQVEAVSGFAVTEFNNWVAGTGRLYVVSLGNNEVIDVGTNEVQTLTEGTAITAGTFTLSLWGQTTVAIASPWSAALVQAALEAVPGIGPGNVSVTGGPLDTAPLTVTFINQLAGLNIPQLTSNQTGLTGTFTHATSTPGVGSRRALNLYVPGKYSSFAMDGEDEGTRTYNATIQSMYDAAQAYSVAIEAITSRTAAFAA